MGYRSEVIVGVRTQDLPKWEEIQQEEVESINEWRKKMKEEYPESNNFEALTSLDYFTIVEQNEDITLFRADYLKWYEGNEYVQKIHSLVDWEDEDNPNFVVAIGEDNAVHTELGDYWEYVSISLNIETHI